MNNFFKFLFWFITAAVSVLVVVMSVIIGRLMVSDPDFPMPMAFFFAVMFLFIISIYIAIAVFVYRDAPNRGMNRWMWMTIATFIPNFIGLIIYVIVRSNYGKKCLSCGKQVKHDYEVCPYCGNNLNQHCLHCGKTVANNWKICPYCQNNLS